MKNVQKICAIILVSFAVIRCGVDSNINGLIFVNANEKAYSIEFLMAKAEHYFDKKDYAKAEQYANKVLAINPTNEDASILLGYVSLADAGVEIFGLTGRLIDMNKNSSTTTSLATTTSSAFSTLGSLQDVLFPDSKIMNEALTTPTVTVGGKTINGEDTSDYGDNSTYAIKFPVTITEARGEKSTIAKINTAISYICPMVAAAAKTIDPDRYKDCPAYTGEIRANAKIHFLWALAHLTESAAFYAPLLQALDPLKLRVTSLQGVTPTDAAGITSFLGKIADLANIVGYIFPDEGSDAQKASLLNAIFNDLKTTNLSFGQIKGIPSEVTDSIDKALNSLMSAQDQIKTGTKTTSTTQTDISKAQLTKLKDQFTNEMAKKMETKINTLNETKPLDSTQKADACDAIKALSTTTYSTMTLCQ